MIQELLYTSHEGKGLRAGSGGGFCTVLSSEGMSSNLASILEKLSGYKHPFDAHDPRSQQNPVNYRHVVVQVGGISYHVLSRIGDLRREHTGRTNKLAHHLVLPRNELPKAGPTALFLDPTIIRADWDNRVTLVPPISSSRLPTTDSAPRVCRAWAAVSGDAGWAGEVARELLGSTATVVSVIYPLGTDALALCDEVFSLIPPAQRWSISFSTYCAGQLPAACQLRFLLSDTPDAEKLRRDYRQKVVDLASTLPAPPSSPLVVAARTGNLADASRGSSRPERLTVMAPDAPPPDQVLDPLTPHGMTSEFPGLQANSQMRQPSQRSRRSSSDSRASWLFSWKGAAAASAIVAVLVMLALGGAGIFLYLRWQRDPMALNDPAARSTNPPGNSATPSSPGNGDERLGPMGGEKKKGGGGGVGSRKSPPADGDSGSNAGAVGNEDTPGRSSSIGDERSVNEIELTTGEATSTRGGADDASPSAGARHLPHRLPVDGAGTPGGDTVDGSGRPDSDRDPGGAVDWVLCEVARLPPEIDRKDVRMFERPTSMHLPGDAGGPLELADLLGIRELGLPELTCEPRKSSQEAILVTFEGNKNKPVALIEVADAPSPTFSWESKHIKDIARDSDKNHPLSFAGNRLLWCVLLVRAGSHEYYVVFRQSYPERTLALVDGSVVELEHEPEDSIPEPLYLDRPRIDQAHATALKSLGTLSSWEPGSGDWHATLHLTRPAPPPPQPPPPEPLPEIEVEIALDLLTVKPPAVKLSLRPSYSGGVLPATVGEVSNAVRESNQSQLNLTAEITKLNNSLQVSREQLKSQPGSKPIEKRIADDEMSLAAQQRKLADEKIRLQLLTEWQFKLPVLNSRTVSLHVYAMFPRKDKTVLLRPIWGGTPRIVTSDEGPRGF